MPQIIFPQLQFSQRISYVLEQSYLSVGPTSPVRTLLLRNSIESMPARRRSLSSWILSQRQRYEKNNNELLTAGLSSQHRSLVNSVRIPSVGTGTLYHERDISVAGKEDRHGHLQGSMAMMNNDSNLLLAKAKDQLLTGSVRIYLLNGAKIKCVQKHPSANLNGKGYVRTASGHTLFGFFTNNVFTEDSSQPSSSMHLLNMYTIRQRYQQVDVSGLTAPSPTAPTGASGHTP
ncbi:MAG: hypothetical protein ACRCV3_02630 [Desulfovibrionaceae bacterium]